MLIYDVITEFRIFVFRRSLTNLKLYFFYFIRILRSHLNPLKLFLHLLRLFFRFLYTDHSKHYVATLQNCENRYFCATLTDVCSSNLSRFLILIMSSWRKGGVRVIFYIRLEQKEKPFVTLDGILLSKLFLSKPQKI